MVDGVNYPDEEKTVNEGEKIMGEEKTMNEIEKIMDESETLLSKTKKFGDVELIPADSEKVKEEEKQTQNKENALWEKLRIEFELHSLEGEIKAHIEDKELIEKTLEEALVRKANLEKRLEEIGED